MDIKVYIRTNNIHGKDKIVCICMAGHQCKSKRECERQIIQYDPCQDINYCFANLGDKSYNNVD